MGDKGINKVFDDIAGLTVGVIGDVMLDTYWWGRVDRISPEAPVPIVAVTKKEFRIGGAANVALNLRSLGSSVSLISVTGKDEEGVVLRNLLKENSIDTAFMMESAGRPTTNKIRILSRNQQMMRLDEESEQSISQDEEKVLIDSFRRFLDSKKPHVVILQDYNKGVLTPFVIAQVVALCQERGVITAVDPKRRHFFEYRQVDIFKPNLQEVREGLNMPHDELTDSWLAKVHDELNKRLQHRISLITLSEKGIYFHGPEGGHRIASHLRNIADVSGAGDTVIAVAAGVYAATRDLNLMASISNIAGGLVCEKVGTAAIDKDLLRQECIKLLSSNFT
jgi:rfaE bifunctional protein kinase chain/domain